MSFRNRLFPRLSFFVLAGCLVLCAAFVEAGFAQSSQQQPPPPTQQSAPPAQPQPVFPSAQPASAPAAQQTSSQQQGTAQQPGGQAPQQQGQPQQPVLTPPPDQPGLPGGKSVDTIQMGQQGQQGQSQEPTQNDSGVYVFKKDVEEVVLHATVVDEHGRIVTDLQPNAFTVFEDGKPREIKYVHREDVPVALGIIIDNSGSMREKREKVNIASLDLVRSSNKDDKVFVVNFNEEFFLDQDFTNNLKLLQESLDKIESRGGTALYDAVVASADYVEKSAPRLDTQDHIQKKALFVVTDGEDNSSRETLEQTVRKLQDENAPTVYTIGILGEERRGKAKRALQALAEQTGGLSFFPKDAGEVDEIARTVARDIRSQYTIVFKKPSGETSSGYRQIKVVARAPGHKNLQVRTLSGYYSNANQQRPRRQ